MGDFPTHNCVVTVDGEQFLTVLPCSQLDCINPVCARRANGAHLAAEMYTLDYIESRINEAQAAIRIAMDTRAHWELYREAAQRRCGATQ